jgi:hypothetical protein
MEIVFSITVEADGGYVAEALGHDIVTEADDWDALRDNVMEAVQAYFFDQPRPKSFDCTSSATRFSRSHEAAARRSRRGSRRVCSAANLDIARFIKWAVTSCFSATHPRTTGLQCRITDR